VRILAASATIEIAQLSIKKKMSMQIGLKMSSSPRPVTDGGKQLLL
jgi:hypothetical protein